MTINWENAPDWAKAAIMNGTGNWHWIANADAYSSSLGWHEIGRSQRIKDFASLDAKKWRDSKVLRPTSTAIPVSEQTQTLADAQAEIDRLRAEVERLDQCIGELRMELSKSQERNDELCVANHNQMVKLSKIRKVINEN